MDFGQLYHFLFETFEGIGCLIAIGLVISIIACIIMERRTRKRFVSRGGMPPRSKKPPRSRYGKGTRVAGVRCLRESTKPQVAIVRDESGERGGPQIPPFCP